MSYGDPDDWRFDHDGEDNGFTTFLGWAILTIAALLLGGKLLGLL